MTSVMLSPLARATVAGHPDRPPADARLRVTGARHTYGSRVVLNGVELALYPGQIYGLLGANGAGKTTLMRGICGRLAFDAGSVALDGADPRTDKRARRQLGFVPQDIALFSYLTVRENLAVFARLAGVPRRDLAPTITRALASTGLSSHADQLCRALSGGYQRRVNICASILHDPSLLILDEPTVGIDVDAREAIHTLLGDLRNRGTAILLTTHDLEQAQTLSDRIGILKDGRMMLEGRTSELLRQRFDGQTELIAVVGKVDEARGAALRHLGLIPAQAANTWSCLAPANSIDLQAISRRLQATGVTVKELRIREPDLTTLFIAALNDDAPANSASPGPVSP